MSGIEDFLKALYGNPEAKKLMQEAKEPGSMAEAAAMYAEIAEKAGIDVSKETIQGLLEEKEKGQQAITAEADRAVKQSLDEKDLENVAGGANDGCADTHSPGEWCWFTDSCSVIISYYDDTPQQSGPAIEKEEEEENNFDCSTPQKNYDLTGCILSDAF